MGASGPSHSFPTAVPTLSALRKARRDPRRSTSKLVGTVSVPLLLHHCDPVHETLTRDRTRERFGAAPGRTPVVGSYFELTARGRSFASAIELEPTMHRGRPPVRRRSSVSRGAHKTFSRVCADALDTARRRAVVARNSQRSDGRVHDVARTIPTETRRLKRHIDAVTRGQSAR